MQTKSTPFAIKVEIDVDELAKMIGKRLISTSPDVEKYSQPPLREYLSRAEAAEVMHVSTRQIDHLRASGKLPWIKRGRRILFKRQDLLNWLNEGYVNGGSVR